MLAGYSGIVPTGLTCQLGSHCMPLCSDAKFDKSKPISGGIPHCFPVFGPAPAPMTQHGFARQSDWTVASTSADQQPDERDPEVELVLEDNEYTRGMWCVCLRSVCCLWVQQGRGTLGTGTQPAILRDEKHGSQAQSHVPMRWTWTTRRGHVVEEHAGTQSCNVDSAGCPGRAVRGHGLVVHSNH